MRTVEAPTAATEWEVPQAPGKWWVLLISGIAWMIIGIVVLEFSIDSAATIGYLVGGVLIVMGVTEFMLIATTEGWHWIHAVLGVLFVLGGVGAFLQPFQTFGILAHLFGFLLVLKGIFDLAIGLGTRHVADLWWMMVALGVLEIVLGFWASGYPGRSAQLLVLWVGIGAVARGTTQLVMAFQVRKLRGAMAV